MKMNLPHALLVLAAIVLLIPAAGAEETVPAGQKAFVDAGCDGCHGIAAVGLAFKPEEGAEDDEQAPDLSTVGSKHTAEFLHGYLIKKEEIDGKKHQKRYSGTKEERTVLVDWLLTLKEVAADGSTK